jgi:hypothetical protein
LPGNGEEVARKKRLGWRRIATRKEKSPAGITDEAYWSCLFGLEGDNYHHLAKIEKSPAANGMTGVA